MSKKQKMLAFKLHELSAVGMPAQEGAQAVLIKGRTEKAEAQGAIAKTVAATNIVDGHQHSVILAGVDTYNYGNTSYASSNGDDYYGGHNHSWIRQEDDSILILESAGHTHEIQVIGKEDKDMSGDATKTDQAKTLKELEEKYARLEKVAALSTEHREYFDKLKGDDADKWLAKTAEERDAMIKEGLEKNKIVYTDADGTTYRKSDDPRLVALAMKNDKMAEAVEKAAQERADAEVTKIAEGLTAMPGDLEVRKALVENTLAIKDEATRKKALEALQSHNDEIAKSFRELGVSSQSQADENDPEAEIQKLAEKMQKESTEPMSIQKARMEVRKTPEGRKLAEASRMRLVA